MPNITLAMTVPCIRDLVEPQNNAVISSCICHPALLDIKNINPFINPKSTNNTKINASITPIPRLLDKPPLKELENEVYTIASITDWSKYLV